ncbi:hypothetical protein HX787_17810 [Pseudomonas tolaasii]|uniref:Uncharacterized protein n=2 Tax=Pseudomonas tolaasii TaxID=29442 RepID=A0A7Y8DQQ3_PSETO|nr:hypothetical protein [Pseudomonas tolaasii]ARB29943.1 hypothetical protein B5P22_22505 [Pseudomonas tolaasii]KAB0476353.1 hypothetical protein F7R12_10975 [Pseudomonas tolaasii]MBY8939816.1 hypothetical protein [Pseudomonas tolaasii]NWC21213.1 hypothetical protein [Pseudomonas tolaasii]NWC39140.1 hypothetical protein [Pseudomonas tolaasii]
MRQLSRIGWQRGGLGLFVIGLVILGVIRLTAEDPEIALMLGESWEDMRQRSSAEIDPAIPGEIWGRLPKSDARLRFIDPQYGFVTPTARFLAVSFKYDRVDTIRMSPQIEPLLLDDALKVVLDLQHQWTRAGWVPIRITSNPPFADTLEWRTRLRNVNRGGTSYWWAENKYQVMLVVGRFKDIRNPTEERYLITLELARPRGQP